MSNVYLLEAKMEFLKSLRMKVYSLSTVLFPTMFYCFFVLSMGQSRDFAPMARYTLATYGAFGVMGATLFAFGVGMAFGAIVVILLCALGLAIGNFAGPNSAPATVNLIYLPMAFCSGLWIPFDVLPKGIQAVAPFLPSFHLSQIALQILGARTHGAAGIAATAVALPLYFLGY